MTDKEFHMMRSSVEFAHKQHFTELPGAQEPIIKSIEVVGIQKWNIPYYIQWLQENYKRFEPSPREVDEWGYAPSGALAQNIGESASTCKDIAKALDWPLSPPKGKDTLDHLEDKWRRERAICPDCNGGGKMPSGFGFTTCSYCKGSGEGKKQKVENFILEKEPKEYNLPWLVRHYSEGDFHYDGERWLYAVYEMRTGEHYLKEVPKGDVPPAIVLYTLKMELI